MLWHIKAPNAHREQFEKPEIQEILYDFDGPKIFTSGSPSQLNIWYECGEELESRTLRYIVAATNQKLISQLKQGKKTLFDVLDQPWIWVVDKDFDMTLKGAWILDSLELIPIDAKPAPQATLYPEHMPLLSYRLIGSGLTEGNVPSSVIAKAVGGPTAALRRLFESLDDSQPQTSGRPEEILRKAYDLPAIAFAYKSFEVTFGKPTDIQLSISGTDPESIYEKSAENLDKGISWLKHSGDEEDLETPILEALKELMPPAHGQVEFAEISGQIIGQRMPIRLTRSDRRKVTFALKNKLAIEQPTLQTIGIVRELDKDNLSFILRSRPEDAPALKCFFPEDLYDDIVEFFNSDEPIRVAGRYKRASSALDVSSALPNTPEGPVDIDTV